MAKARRLGGLVPQAHKAADGEARIEITIDNSDPIELIDFTASLVGFAREHESRTRKLNAKVKPDETKLLVVDVRKGSIVLELLPALAPFVTSMEYTNIAVEFVRHLGNLFTPLRQAGGRLEDTTTQQLKNLNDMVLATAKDTNGRLAVAAKYQNGDVIQEIVIGKEDALVIAENTERQRQLLDDKSSATLNRVLMTLHQSSVENLKLGTKTAEKGIVERVDANPRTLIYVSDIAGQRIKEEIRQPGGNPFQKGFIVDLDVETVGGKPKAYRILNVHEVIDLDDD